MEFAQNSLFGMVPPEKTDRISQLLHGSTAILIGLLLTGVSMLGVSTASAQVHIEQIGPVASQLNGVTQGQLVMTMPRDCNPDAANCDNVSRSDVLGLVPGTTPVLPGSDGNSAVVSQAGDRNDARIEQQGTGHRATVAQGATGTRNEAAVVQRGLTGDLPGSDGEFLPPPFESFPDVPAGPAFENAEGVPFRDGELQGSVAGEENLAVVVQNGSDNDTNVAQLGRKNIAGIRLSGSGSSVDLLQAGAKNGFLLDTDKTLERTFQQVGANNQLVLDGNGLIPSVRMQGSGMRMIIRHNP